MHCWCWCGGWQPALWAMYEALYPVNDWDMAAELMQVIRRHVRSQDQAER